jgi:hypothetical protein
MLTDVIGAVAVLFVAVLTKDLPVDASAAIAVVVLLVYTLIRAIVFWTSSTTPSSERTPSIDRHAPRMMTEDTIELETPVVAETPEFDRYSPSEMQPEITIRATPPQFTGEQKSDLKAKKIAMQQKNSEDHTFYLGLALLFMSVSFAMFGMAFDQDSKRNFAGRGALPLRCTNTPADTPELTQLREGSSVLVYCPEACPLPANNRPSDTALWGSGHYTDDSQICLAAKHIGVVPNTLMRLTIHGAQDLFCPAATSSGVSSQAYTAWHRSYSLGTNHTGKWQMPPADTSCNKKLCVAITYADEDALWMVTLGEEHRPKNNSVVVVSGLPEKRAWIVHYHPHVTRHNIVVLTHAFVGPHRFKPAEVDSEGYRVWAYVDMLPKNRRDHPDNVKQTVDAADAADAAADTAAAAAAEAAARAASGADTRDADAAAPRRRKGPKVTIPSGDSGVDVTFEQLQEADQEHNQREGADDATQREQRQRRLAEQRWAERKRRDRKRREKAEDERRRREQPAGAAAGETQGSSGQPSQQLEALWQQVLAAGLTTEGAIDGMRRYMKLGRFDEAHYLRMWSQRLNEHTNGAPPGGESVPGSAEWATEVENEFEMLLQEETVGWIHRKGSAYGPRGWARQMCLTTSEMMCDEVSFSSLNEAQEACRLYNDCEGVTMTTWYTSHATRLSADGPSKWQLRDGLRSAHGTEESYEKVDLSVGLSNRRQLSSGGSGSCRQITGSRADCCAAFTYDRGACSPAVTNVFPSGHGCEDATTINVNDWDDEQFDCELLVRAARGELMDTRDFLGEDGPLSDEEVSRRSGNHASGARNTRGARRLTDSRGVPLSAEQQLENRAAVNRANRAHTHNNNNLPSNKRHPTSYPTTPNTPNTPNTPKTNAKGEVEIIRSPGRLLGAPGMQGGVDDTAIIEQWTSASFDKAVDEKHGNVKHAVRHRTPERINSFFKWLLQEGAQISAHIDSSGGMRAARAIRNQETIVEIPDSAMMFSTFATVRRSCRSCTLVCVDCRVCRWLPLRVSNVSVSRSLLARPSCCPSPPRITSSTSSASRISPSTDSMLSTAICSGRNSSSSPRTRTISSQLSRSSCR